MAEDKKCVIVTIKGDDGKCMTAKICGKDLNIQVVEEN